MSDELVLIEKRDRIATVTLNRPPMNPMSVRMFDALHAGLTEIEKDHAIRCIVLTGAGERAVCAGADIREESSFKTEADSTAFRDYGRRTLERIESCTKPIVAAIQGYCIGGGTAVGWSCDIRIAADNAVFRAGDAYLGLVPSWGMGLTRLPRLVGRNRALDILLLGENFSAATALDLGLVTRVVPNERLQVEARSVAERITKASPQAILATRRAVNFNARHSWDEMVRYEQEICREVFAHPDAAEGPLAFLEKREPRFSDQ
jgi:enoyl-CoA hydratase/carnithine racemase